MKKPKTLFGTTKKPRTVKVRGAKRSMATPQEKKVKSPFGKVKKGY